MHNPALFTLNAVAEVDLSCKKHYRVARKILNNNILRSPGPLATPVAMIHILLLFFFKAGLALSGLPSSFFSSL